MIESIEKVKIEDKFITKRDVDPAIHDITVRRKAKNPELETMADANLFPRQRRDKYEQRFSFVTEDLVTRAWNLLHELEQIDVAVFVSAGGDSIIIQTVSDIKLHNEFNKVEIVQLKEILDWIYAI